MHRSASWKHWQDNISRTASLAHRHQEINKEIMLVSNFNNQKELAQQL